MSATNRGCERKAYDFYATPPETVRAFLANFDGISSGDRILESEKRFKWWQEHPLSGLYTLHKRPSFTGRGTDATSYSWFVWERGGPAA